MPNCWPGRLSSTDAGHASRCARRGDPGRTSVRHQIARGRRENRTGLRRDRRRARLRPTVRRVRGPWPRWPPLNPTGLASRVSVLPGMVPGMINDLESIDWASMGHAYGPADDVPQWLHDMALPDAEPREQAFSSFYGAAHHQGDVYPCTVASLPFLFAMADSPSTPDRASVVALIVSIGREAVDHEGFGGVWIGPDGQESTAYQDAAALIRGRGEAFVGCARDADARVRGAAIAGLGLFLDDAERAVGVLRGGSAPMMRLQRPAQLSARTAAGPKRFEPAERAMRTRREVVADAYDDIVESYPTQVAARSARRTAQLPLLSRRHGHRTRRRRHRLRLDRGRPGGAGRRGRRSGRGPALRSGVEDRRRALPPGRSGSVGSVSTGVSSHVPPVRSCRAAGRRSRSHRRRRAGAE